ncbi:MAG: secretin and TonB N-terminal domain-containing protein [Smithellaceae bacterium]|jgi:type IV pilus assembly protein PilQ
MKKYLSKIFLLLIIILWVFTYISETSLAVETADKNQATDDKAEATVAKVGYLENVLLEKSSGKERINLIVSQQTTINVETQTNGSLLIKLENMFAPENMRRQFGEGELNNILHVTPVQQLVDGKQWIYLSVNLKKIVPYSIKQEGQSVLIDFNVSSLPEKKSPVSPVVIEETPKVTEKKKIVAKVATETAKKTDDIAASEEAKVKPIKKETVKRYTDRMISIDFQDADIKSVFRLMAEYGDISIVSGDDVKGNVTLSMKNVPWEQALDTILDINGLAKKQMGDVISVMTLERKKKDEADKVSAEENQRKAEDTRKERETKLLADKGKLRQILIEAKIVEATEEFIRNVGVTWGVGNQQSISGGTYGLGLSGGSSTLQTNSIRQAYPPQIGLLNSSVTPATTLSMAAVNLPAAVAGPTLGIVFGGATGFLEAQIAALESNNRGKLISSPKVVTMDNVKAIIKQGADVPYVTPASGNSPATVTFKEAVLKLEVKPKITDEGKISMEIIASNDVPDYTKATILQGNPPINKNDMESTVVVQDGDTVVIGGVSTTNEQKLVTGVPWFQKIPILGWLFKTENVDNTNTQLLIFITPKILKGSGFTESAEKIIN